MPTEDVWRAIVLLMIGQFIESRVIPAIAQIKETQARYDREFAEIVERY